MSKSPLQAQSNQSHSLTRRRTKDYLPSGVRRLRTSAGNYVAEFDSVFCVGDTPCDLVEHIEALLKAGQIIKDGDSCHVSRLVWNYMDVVVKRYNHQGLIHSLRHTIKKSRARRAWLYAHYLGAIGVATPKPLAYIEHRKGPLVWQSYLLTEYVEGRKLWNFLRDDDVRGDQRLEGIREVVEMLGRLWQHNITHGDLKHTNVLITDQGPILTDLDAMVVHRWNLSYRNKRTKDIRRFLKKTDVSRELHDYCRTLISKATHPARRATDDFDRIRKDGWTIQVRRDLHEHVLSDLLPLDDLSEKEFSPVPSSNYTRVLRASISFDRASRVFYLKQYLCRSTLDFAKHFVRASRAKRAFNASLMLQQNGFDAPFATALLERRIGPFCTRNFLLTEEVENSTPMSQALTDIRESYRGDALAEKRALIRAFARMVGELHAKGIFHGDLRLGNVLVVREGPKWRFFLVDNERTRKLHFLPARLRLKNLVQINMFVPGISNADRMRFFKVYLSMNPSVQMRYGKWAQRIVSKTRKRLSDKERSKD